MPSCASSSCVALERDVGDEQRDGEPDAGNSGGADELTATGWSAGAARAAAASPARSRR